MDILQTISQEFNLTATHTKNIVALLDEGNTVPFIARYRKEATGNLNETEIKNISDVYNYQLNLLEKKEARAAKKTETLEEVSNL